MALRKLGKLLLYRCAGIFGARHPVDAGRHAWRSTACRTTRPRSRSGCTARSATISPSRACRRRSAGTGRNCISTVLELRSKDDLRVLAHAAGGRIGIDLWQLIRSGKLFAGRIELDSPKCSDRAYRTQRVRAGGGDQARRTADASVPMVTLDDLPSGIARHPARIGHGPELGPGAAAARIARPSIWTCSAATGSRSSPSLAAPARGAGRRDQCQCNGARPRTPGYPELECSWPARADLSLAGWRDLLPDYLTRLGTGIGGFELAAVGRGAELARADLDFNATAVTTQLTDEPGVKFDQIAGTLTVTHAGDRWTLSGRRVRAHGSRSARPGVRVRCELARRRLGVAGIEGAGELSARRNAAAAGRAAAAKDLRERLQEIEPTGEWLDTRVDLARDTADGSLAIHRAGADSVASALRPSDARRACAASAGQSRAPATAVGWTSKRAAHRSSGLRSSPRPIVLEKFKTTLFWRRTAEELLVATPSIELKTHDAALHGPAAWHQPADGSPPSLTLAASVDDGNAAAAHLYYPRALLPPPALAWLNRAFVAGHLSHADVVLQGPVRAFSISRRHRPVSGARPDRGLDARLPRGLAARGEPRRAWRNFAMRE